MGVSLNLNSLLQIVNCVLLPELIFLFGPIRVWVSHLIDLTAEQQLFLMDGAVLKKEAGPPYGLTVDLTVHLIKLRSHSQRVYQGRSGPAWFVVL